MIENEEIVIFSALKSKFYQYFFLTKNCSKGVSHFFLKFSTCIFQIESPKTLSTEIIWSLDLIWGLKNGPLLLSSKYKWKLPFFHSFWPPPRKVKKKILIVTNSFSRNKKYVKIKLMQNETNRWNIFLVKKKYW